MAVIRVTITEVSRDTFKGRIDDHKKKITTKRQEVITWNLKAPDNFPDDGLGYVQFDDDGCFVDGKKNKGRQNGSKFGGHFISGTVSPNAELRTYVYKVGYTQGITDYCLLDPEIVVDGGQIALGDHGNRHRRGRRKLLAKRAHLASRRKELRRARAKKAAKRARR